MEVIDASKFQIQITLDRQKVDKYQSKKLIRVNPDNIRNGLFFIIPAPVRIDGPNANLEIKVILSDDKDLEKAYTVLTEMKRRTKGACERVNKRVAKMLCK